MNSAALTEIENAIRKAAFLEWGTMLLDGKENVLALAAFDAANRWKQRMQPSYEEKVDILTEAILPELSKREALAASPATLDRLQAKRCARSALAVFSKIGGE